jgi:hypothetical protein
VPVPVDGVGWAKKATKKRHRTAHGARLFVVVVPLLDVKCTQCFLFGMPGSWELGVYYVMPKAGRTWSAAKPRAHTPPPPPQRPPYIAYLCHAPGNHLQQPRTAGGMRWVAGHLYTLWFGRYPWFMYSLRFLYTTRIMTKKTPMILSTT